MVNFIWLEFVILKKWKFRSHNFSCLTCPYQTNCWRQLQTIVNFRVSIPFTFLWHLKANIVINTVADYLLCNFPLGYIMWHGSSGLYINVTHKLCFWCMFFILLHFFMVWFWLLELNIGFLEFFKITSFPDFAYLRGWSWDFPMTLDSFMLIASCWFTMVDTGHWLDQNRIP